MGVYPNSLNDLVSTNYLKSIPVARAEQVTAMANAFASSSSWSLVSPGQPVIVLSPVTFATCKAYNFAQFGMAGILRAAHIAQPNQCVGSDLNNLMIVQAKSGADLTFVAGDPAAVVQIGPVVATPLPVAGSVDSSNDGRLSAPGADNQPPETAPLSAAFVDEDSGDTLNGYTFVNAKVGTHRVGHISLTNYGTEPSTLGTVSTTAPFSVTENDCAGATLAPMDTCYLTLDFQPTAIQGYTGELAIEVVGSYTVRFPLEGMGNPNYSGAQWPTFAYSGTGRGIAGSASVSMTGTSVMPWPYSFHAPVDESCVTYTSTPSKNMTGEIALGETVTVTVNWTWLESVEGCTGAGDNFDATPILQFPAGV